MTVLLLRPRTSPGFPIPDGPPMKIAATIIVMDTGLPLGVENINEPETILMKSLAASPRLTTLVTSEIFPVPQRPPQNTSWIGLAGFKEAQQNPRATQPCLSRASSRPRSACMQKTRRISLFGQAGDRKLAHAPCALRSFSLCLPTLYLYTPRNPQHAQRRKSVPMRQSMGVKILL